MAAGEIVELTTVDQFAEAVALQKTIWNYEDDAELLPVRFFVVAAKVGGQVFGAYADGRMVGFLLAIPGRKPDGRSYLHSHMLGVLPQYRDSGLGRAMKLKQRENALARGFDLIEWTFDPLELKNAWFNIEILGAIARRYVRNQYGMSTSAFAGGLPTDRLIAEWWISKQRFRAPVVDRIRVPDVRSLEAQEQMAGRFEDCFSRGLAVTGIERFEGGIDYLLGAVE